MVIRQVFYLFAFTAGTLLVSTGASAQDEGFWKLVCSGDQASRTTKSCLLRGDFLTDEGQRVARVVFGIANTKSGRAWYINAIMPLGLHIPSGAGYRVDGAKPKPLALQYCDPNGCRGNKVLSGADLSQIKRGNTLRLIMADGKSRKGIGLDFTLTGVTAAMKRLDDLPTP